MREAVAQLFGAALVGGAGLHLALGPDKGLGIFLVILAVLAAYGLLQWAGGPRVRPFRRSA